MLFVCFYLATLIVFTAVGFPYGQWAYFLAAGIATIASLRLWDRGDYSVGLAVPPRLGLRDFLYGSAFGSLLVALGALAIALTTDVRHERGNGFPWTELALIYLPAAVHEELLFRGYAFQKLHQWNRTFTLLFAAVLFAVLHMRNLNVSWIGLANIFLGGILLGLAYELYARLWFPIGVHLLWNVMSGPILGHEVSGYDSMRTLFVERGGGPWWLTGGDFGIEGSVWMTAAEVAGIVVLWRRGQGRRKEESRRPTIRI